MNDVISLIDTDEVKSLLTGRVWAVIRGDNRDHLTDIVVRTLNGTADYIQNFDVNVRLHVANIPAQNSGAIDWVPNLITFDTINKVLNRLLDNQYRPSFYTDVAIPGEPMKDRDGTWFSTTRVTYRSVRNDKYPI